jgi:hypothetical protein
MSSSYEKKCSGSVNSAILAATLLASYLANCKRFTAHFSYISCDQPERVFFIVEETASAACASMSEDRLQATLVLIQIHREKT